MLQVATTFHSVERKACLGRRKLLRSSKILTPYHPISIHKIGSVRHGKMLPKNSFLIISNPFPLLLNNYTPRNLVWCWIPTAAAQARRCLQPSNIDRHTPRPQRSRHSSRSWNPRCSVHWTPFQIHWFVIVPVEMDKGGLSPMQGEMVP